MKVAAFLLLALTNFASAADQKYLVFVGTYTDSGSKGIYSFQFDADGGAATEPILAAKSDNPSFLLVNEAYDLLYAANEIEKFRGQTDGSISVFRIDLKKGELVPEQVVSSGGWGPVYLSADGSGQHLLVADYGAGTVAVLPVGAEGKLGTNPKVVKHQGTKENPARPHAIVASDSNRFVLVPDLGLNKLFVYRFDADRGILKEDEALSFAFRDSVGPRHLAISPAGDFVYLANETDSSVAVFSWAAESGKLQELQRASTIANEFKGENTASEIELDSSGKFLYVSNRGEDSIAVFGVGEDGKLSLAGRTPTEGKTPRTFAIDPTGKWMLVANQGSNTIRVFKRNPDNGLLSPTSSSVFVAAPAHLVFVPLQR